MQGPSGFLNVLTIPPGASSSQSRIVIDGVHGAVLVYGGNSTGQLTGSISPTVFNDEFGNEVLSGTVGYDPTTASALVGVAVSFYLGTPSNWTVQASIELGPGNNSVEIVAPGGLYVNGTQVTVP